MGYVSVEYGYPIRYPIPVCEFCEVSAYHNWILSQNTTISQFSTFSLYYVALFIMLPFYAWYSIMQVATTKFYMPVYFSWP